MTNKPTGFSYEIVGDDVIISHHGRRATILRGVTAKRFLADVQVDVDVAVENLQELMARLTGNYRHGNERTAKNHPRNQRR